MSKILIKPTKAGFPLQDAVSIQINAFMSLGGKESRTHWMLMNDKGGVLHSNNCDIPEEIHSQWGVDDDVIEDYVLGELGLERL